MDEPRVEPFMERALAMENSGRRFVLTPRFQVRTLMIAVFCVAVVLAGAWRLAEFKATSTSYRALASLYASNRRATEKSLKTADIPELRKWLVQMIDHYKDLEGKYSAAARKPWSRVPNDPEAPPLPLPLPIP